MLQTTNSNKLVISSGFFIVIMVALDASLNSEFEKIPREIVGGIVLVLLLGTFDFIGLGRLAGPFAVLIAGTVFLSRGNHILSKLRALSSQESGDTSAQSLSELSGTSTGMSDNQSVSGGSF